MVAWVVLVAWTACASAHEVRPAYLHIHQLAKETYATTWRVPAKGGTRLGIYLEMPSQCAMQGALLNWRDGGTFVEQATYTCPGGLVDSNIVIGGLELTLTDALARIERLDGTTQVALLTPADNALTVTASANWSVVASTYFVFGVKHILLGIDHLLFVLALLLLVPNVRTLAWAITSFTLAHSVTLAAATLGLARVPQQPVEAVIALSILFVAMEIVHCKQGRPGITVRWPWLVAFTFGLLHGFGFAGALLKLGLPDDAIPLALLFFNLGVEAGQLLFIAGVLLVWALLRQFRWPRWLWRLPVYSIGSLAAFWTIERIAGFAT